MFTTAPDQYRMSPAVTSDMGIAVTLISAVRHSNRKSPMIRMTSRQPTSSASVRLSMASSMNVAGRKIVVSILMSVRPGRSSSMADSTPDGDVDGVGPGELLHDEHQARTVVDHRVTGQRLVILDHLGHVGQS